MKIILLIGILCLSLVNVSADQTITCELPPNTPTGCYISSVTIGPNETVSIKTDPEDADANSITFVQFTRSSLYAVPREVFTKFPNLNRFHVGHQKIQEIPPNTFLNARKLTFLDLGSNALTSLAVETFKGKFSIPYQFF
jgi:hypothetical protein